MGRMIRFFTTLFLLSVSCFAQVKQWHLTNTTANVQEQINARATIIGTNLLSANLLYDGASTNEIELDDFSRIDLDGTDTSVGGVASLYLDGGITTLRGVTNLQVITPGVFAGTATANQVLTLVDPLEGTSEFVDLPIAGIYLALAGGTMSGQINMGSQKISSLAAGTVGTDAVNKAQMDALLTNTVFGGAGSITVPPGTTAQRPGSPTEGMIRYNSTTGNMESYGAGAWRVWLRQDGSLPMTGALAMGSQRITGLGTPNATTDATTKTYVDTGIQRGGFFAGSSGLDFDGNTASTDVTTDISTHAVGTNDLTAWMRTEIRPTLSRARTLMCITTDSGSTPIQATALLAYISSGGDLVINFYGATTSDIRTATIASFVTTYSGTVVDIVLTRQSATFKLYINGTDTAYTETTSGSPPAWSATVGSTFLHVGPATSLTAIYNSTVYRMTLFNRALSASDVASLVTDGVSYGDRWASATAQYSSDFASAITGWAAVGGGVTATHSAGRLNITYPASGSGGAVLSTSPLIFGRNSRISFVHKIASGALSSILVRDSGASTALLGLGGHSVSFTPSGSDQTFTLDVTEQPVSGASGFTYLSGTATGAGCVLEIDNFSITRIGAFVDHDYSAGVGYQVQDASANKLNGTAAGGIGWRAPKINGRVSATLTVNTGERMLGNLAIPTDAHIETVIVENVNVGSGALFSLGTAGGSLTTILSAMPLGGNGTKSVFSPAVSNSSTGNLHASWTAAGTVKVTILYTLTI